MNRPTVSSASGTCSSLEPAEQGANDGDAAADGDRHDVRRVRTAVTRVLSKVEGVESVTADHTANMVGVTFDPERVTPRVIRQQIEGLGYDVAP